MIELLRLHRLQVPLATPYKLAFGPVRHFDMMLAEVVLADGGSGIGEATILNGYTDEDIDSSWRRLLAASDGLVGMRADDAVAAARRSLAGLPFTQTAVVTAIEMAQGSPLLAFGNEVRIPILHGLNATDARGIEREIDTALARGYRTLKIKVGFDVEADLARVALIQRLNAGRAKLRIDANQGYLPEEGAAFAARIDPASVELLEQPCRAGDWSAAGEVARASTVPLMLDESIYATADIERAAGIGAAFVKLKLMKLAGLRRLRDGLRRIRALGMTPVLGNGVAGDIGCWMEACIAAREIDNAGEMNGLLRPVGSLLVEPLAVECGAIVVPAGFRAVLDPGRLAEWLVAGRVVATRARKQETAQ